MIDRLRKISYILAYAVATIPLWHYIRDGRILALMVAIVVFAYVMVVLSSVQAAQPILSSEKVKTALPKWLPDKPKYHTWWMIVRRTLKWHLLLVIPKMGLALGFVHYFYFSRKYDNDIIFRNYDYHSYGHGYGESFSIVDIPSSQLLTYIIGFLVIVIFTMLEVQLSASGIVQLSKSYSNLQMRTLAKRLFIVISTIGVILVATQYLTPLIISTIHATEIPCRIGYEFNILNFPNPGSRCVRQIEQTINTVVSTVVGQGVLLSANFMRPLRQGGQFGSYCWTDNRLFLIRQTMATFLGVMLYIFLIRLNLWFVEDEVQS